MIQIQPKNMPRRIIEWGLILLVLIGFIAFAYFMMSVSRQSAVEELHRENRAIVNTQANELKSELQKYLLVPFILGENPDVIQTLNSRDPAIIDQLNVKLEKLALQTEASYIFVFDTTGTTIASSNYNAPNSFVGESYEFRPYFRQAMDEGSAQYFAKGETTGKAGLFLAGRISDREKPIGGIVIKVEFSQIAQRWNDQNATSLVTDRNSIILFSNDQSLNYKTLTPLTDAQRAKIIADKQFRDEPLSASGIDIDANLLARDPAGQRLLVDLVSIPELNWNLLRIIPVKPAMATANARAQLIILLVGVFLSGIAFFFRRRFVREKEKAEITEYLKSEVNRQTKKLSVANDQLKHEIAERELVNQRFRAAREELAQANRLGSIGAITASVAHELNQPVAAIRARAENATKLLKRGDSARVSENLGLIVDLTARIGSISTELRRYARRGSQAISSVSLDDVMDGLQILMGDRLKSKGINLVVGDNVDALPPVIAGRVRLEQVLVNLLQNSLDALQGHTDPRVHIIFKVQKNMVVITVSDNGPGISEENTRNIFTPFFTDKPNGMGMGLGIAKDIMTDFGGTIETIPSFMGGAAFQLKLKRFK